MAQTRTVFEYLYRDAGNFKTYVSFPDPQTPHK
jgi:hypothetical protein